jgi:DNA repair photolyase
MRKLADAGILTGITMMPILPFLEDSEENIGEIIHQAKEHGASYIIPAFGVSLRPGSRDYYYRELDLLFPGIKEKYIQEYGDSYQCSAPNWRELHLFFEGEMEKLDLSAKIPIFEPRPRPKGTKQMPLFN